MTTLDAFISPKLTKEPVLETKTEPKPSKVVYNPNKKQRNKPIKPWTQTYAPKKSSEIISQDTKKIKEFILNYNSQKKKGMILWGPSGTGKSCAAYAFAEEFGHEIIEINASDKRNKATIEELLDSALNQQSLFGKGKILLIDDIDGLSGFKDRGGAAAIAKIMQTSTFPVIMTCQDVFSKKVKPVRSKSQLVEFKEHSPAAICEHLRRICIAENITADAKDLNTIAKHANGDLRAAINDAQMLTIGRDTLDTTLLDELEDRLQNKDLQESIAEILNSKSGLDVLHSFDTVNEDHNALLMWLDQNIPAIYKGKADRARAFGCLTKADVFIRRIRRRQHWRFLVYIYALLTAGIATSKSVEVRVSPDKLVQPTRILKMWQANMKYAKRKAIAEKIAAHTHSSTKDVIKNFEFYKIIIGNNPNIANELDLSEEEVGFLS
jgi:replication factor C large subunit